MEQMNGFTEPAFYIEQRIKITWISGPSSSAFGARLEVCDTVHKDPPLAVLMGDEEQPTEIYNYARGDTSGMVHLERHPLQAAMNAKRRKVVQEPQKYFGSWRTHFRLKDEFTRPKCLLAAFSFLNCCSIEYARQQNCDQKLPGRR
ncbi:MAG: hypothetical protein Q9163_000069 [Psora crenata]